MNPYLIPVGCLNALVSFFLLLAADRITEGGGSLYRIVLASLWSGIYGGICVITNLTFLGNTLWRLLSMALSGVIAWYGCGGALLAGVLYGILQLAMTGLAAGLNSWVGAVFLALAVCILWVFGWQGHCGRMVSVKIPLGDQFLTLSALRDTGNTLTDAITGHPVLVVGADVGEKLIGLSPAQLRKPTECMERGLRLIPYRTVSHPGGLLLAKKIECVRIGKWQGSVLVAFAPEVLDAAGKFQALIGGRY